jgi:hypothetical protein
MSEQPNNKIFEMNNQKIRYTLQGTQPYVLSGQWPSYFIPTGTEIIPDNSMNNILGYNIEKQEQYSTYNNFNDR